MQLSLDNLKNTVKRHLSVIGKRTFTKDGHNMFSNITVSTAEDPIINEYLIGASQVVNALLHQLITAWSVAGSTITATLVNERGDSDFEAKAKGFIETFMILSATCDYLAMTHPDIAQKYRNDTTGALQTLLSYVFYKNPVTPTADPLSPTVVVTDTEPNTDTDTDTEP